MMHESSKRCRVIISNIPLPPPPLLDPLYLLYPLYPAIKTSLVSLPVFSSPSSSCIKKIDVNQDTRLFLIPAELFNDIMYYLSGSEFYALNRTSLLLRQRCSKSTRGPYHVSACNESFDHCNTTTPDRFWNSSIRSFTLHGLSNSTLSTFYSIPRESCNLGFNTIVRGQCINVSREHQCLFYIHRTSMCRLCHHQGCASCKKKVQLMLSWYIRQVSIASRYQMRVTLLSSTMLKIVHIYAERDALDI